MTTPSVSAAIDAIYASLRADNAELDERIAELKAALAAEGQKEAVFDPAQLAQNNRQGRKLMQAYFRQRGVAVSFGGKSRRSRRPAHPASFGDGCNLPMFVGLPVAMVRPMSGFTAA